ncbi:MAG TPA: CoA pyrophosphatase [Hyphomicrobiaceae bacterium]|jgi:8-oxo-dGTP pyrophosphatase MutT (NUDIX family)|nr:CoA pyrophosphatase [Hyphomicrobiaceae bacterium]
MDSLASKSDPGPDAADFRRRAAERLMQVPSDAVFDPRSGRALGPSDWDLNPEFKGDLAIMEPPRPAAVLVPIVLRETLTVLFTQRSHDVPSHPGQISFPGGKMEAWDATPLDCALREAQEEIGLPRAHAEPLGYLDSYRTGTGFQINPVVAFVRPGFDLFLDPREVLDVFEVPLGFLMNPGNHQKHSREWRGRQRAFYAMPYEGHYIWGATAGILKNMYERLFAR